MCFHVCLVLCAARGGLACYRMFGSLMSCFIGRPRLLEGWRMAKHPSSDEKTGFFPPPTHRPLSRGPWQRGPSSLHKAVIQASGELPSTVRWVL